MDILVLNQKFEVIHLVDGYRSMIWTDRYNEAGDFELYTEVSGKVLDYVTKDVYLTIKDSDRTMIVSDINVISDRELGNYIKITGYSLERILNRRIVWGLKTLKTDLQNGIKTLLNESIISPSDEDRKISNFIFEQTSDERITKLKIDTQFTGDNIYDIVSSLCAENDVGWKLLLNSKNQFVFSLYAGVDRSYDQTNNPYVLFSPSYENLVNSNYYDTNKDLKTVTLIGGEGEDTKRKYTTYIASPEKGLNRRELFTDARDIQSEYRDEKGNEVKLSNEAYLAKLKDRGKEKLNENKAVTAFEGEVEPTRSFVYKKDYYLGDIVQIENEYGFKGTARITEVVTSHDDSSGYTLYPTFEMMDDKEGGK